MSDWRLTLYGDDDETPIQIPGVPAAEAVPTCSTVRTGPRPYLLVPDSFAESEIDLSGGRSVIGQINLRVLDRRTSPADQQSGWFTALLAHPAAAGGALAGETALNGRRARVEQTDDGTHWFVVLDGVVGGVSLDESKVTYTLSVRDIRERERKTRAFVRTDTALVFPRGVKDGYGRPYPDAPASEWLVPPTPGLVGTYRVTQLGSYVDFGARYGSGADQPIPPELVVTEAMREAARGTAVYVEHRDQVLHSGETVSLPMSRITYPNLVFLWRLPGASVWTAIQPVTLETPGWDAPDYFASSTRRGELANGEEADGITALHFPGETGPADGESVEVMIQYVGAPTEDYPLHLEMPAGELIRRLYDGAYSVSADDPATEGDESQIPFARIRYDADAIGGLEVLGTMLRARITEPAEDLREWMEENVYQPLGVAPALNERGEVAPVSCALPGAGDVLFDFNDGNTAPDATWEHATSDVVNYFTLTYQRDYRIHLKDDPTGEASAGDGVASVEVTVGKSNPVSIHLLGEKPVEIEPVTLRAIGGAGGSPGTGHSSDEPEHRLSAALAQRMLDRFAYGGQSVVLRCRRSECRHLAVGMWARVALSWLPEYGTGKRGSNRLAQIVAARDLSPAWREFRLVDAGPDHQPLPHPSLGAPTVGAGGVVAVPVLSVPSGARAEVEYYLSEAPPGGAGSLWMPLGATVVPATLQSPRLPAGRRVWIRARAAAEQRISSAYTTPVDVVVPVVPRVEDVRIDLDPLTRRATVSWVPNAFALGVRVRYQEHEPDLRVSPSEYVEGNGQTAFLVLPHQVTPGKEITVEVEPWSGWTGTSVSGTAGERVGRSQRLPAAAVHRVRTRVELSEDGATGTLTLRISDPDRLVADVGFFVIGAERGESGFIPGRRTRTGPHPADEVPEPGTYRKRVELHTKYNTIVEPVVTLSDGSTLRPGGETFDRNRSANLVGRPQVAYDGDQAVVMVTGDSDTVSLHALEWNGSTWVIPAELAGGNPFALGNRGSFSLTASPLAPRRLRVFGTNAEGEEGPAEEVLVDRYELASPVTGVMWAMADPATGAADLHLRVDGPAAAFPVRAEIYRDSPSGSPMLLDGSSITAHTFVSPGEIGPANYVGLRQVPLPVSAPARWWTSLSDTLENPPAWAHTTADRDRLPGGSVTADDYRTHPLLVCAYDDDVSEVLVMAPGDALATPRRKTFRDLPPGGGVVTYTVGVTPLDGGAVESSFAVDEGVERGTYRVEYRGRGGTTVRFSGPLHGRPSNPPTCEPTVALDAAERNRVDVFLKVVSPVGEDLGVEMKDSDAPGAPVWRWVAVPGSQVLAHAASGSTVGPEAEFFTPGEPNGLRFNNLPLARDQVRRIYVRVVGRESGVHGSWIPVTLGLREQAVLESVDLIWDEGAKRLKLRAVGGAFCESATFEVADDAEFTAPLPPQSKTLTDEGVSSLATVEFSLPAEGRNRVWHGRVTPFNGGLSMELQPTGLPGQPQRDSVLVPPTDGAQAPSALIEFASSNAGSETLRYSGLLGDGGKPPLRWRRRLDRPDTGAGAWGEWMDTLPGEERILRDPFWRKEVVLEVQDADGRTGEDVYEVAPRLEGIDEGTGRLRREAPFDDGEYPESERGAQHRATRAATARDRGGRGEAEAREGRFGVPGARASTDRVYRADGLTELIDTESGVVSNARLHETIIDSTNRAVNRMFAKGLADAPDDADVIVSGRSNRVTTLEEATGGGRGYRALDTDDYLKSGLQNQVVVNGSTAASLYRTNLDNINLVADTPQYARTSAGYLDAGRVAGVYRDTLMVGTANLFRHGVDTLDVVQNSGTYAKPLATYLDAGRIAGVYRDTLLVSAANLFRHSVDTLDVVQNSGSYAKPLATYLDQGRIAAVLRDGVALGSGNLFRRSSDTLDDVQNSTNSRKVNAYFTDTSGSVVNVYRNATAIGVDQLFRRSENSLEDVLDSSNYAKVLGTYLSAGRVSAMFRDTVQVGAPSFFRHSVDTLDVVSDSSTYRRPRYEYVDTSGRIFSVFRNSVAVEAGDLYRISTNSTTDLRVTDTNRDFATATEKAGGNRAANVIDDSNKIRDHTKLYPAFSANRNYAVDGGSSPITASNSGGYVSISVAAHTIRFPWGTLSLPSGDTGGSYSPGTRIYIWAYIVDYSVGPTADYYHSAVISDAVNEPNKYYVGYVDAPEDGGSVGGGGGGCVAADAFLLDGLQAKDARVGDDIDIWIEGTVSEIRRAPIQFISPVKEVLAVRLTARRGATLIVGADTPIVLRDGTEIRAAQAHGAELLVDDAGDLSWECVRVEPVGLREVIYFGLGGAVFAAGERPDARIYTHNLVAVKE